MKTFNVLKRIDPFLMEGTFEDQDGVYVAMVWTGNNAYSLRTLANDVVHELEEKVPTGRFKVDIVDFEIGDLLARPKASTTLEYDPRVKYPDNSGSPLVHVKNPKIVENKKKS